MVTFSGVDGAGKTTVLSEVKKYLENRHSLKVIELRQRPSLLPILSSIKHGKKAAEAKTMQALPRLGTNASKLSSYIRFFYYLTDYLIGQLYIYLKYTSKGYLVLYDRYYFDYIVDPRRANIVIDERIPHFFYNLIFKPTVNVFLFAAPKEILQRKVDPWEFS